MRLSKVRESWETGKPLAWTRVHKIPEHAYFDHSVHLAAGVGCTSCHGRDDQMEVVRQNQPLSMSWCLDCHRNPEPFLVPPDKVTDLFWVEQQLATRGNPATPELGSPGGAALLTGLEQKPLHLLPENCGACHY